MSYTVDDYRIEAGETIEAARRRVYLAYAKPPEGAYWPRRVLVVDEAHRDRP